VQVNRQCFLAKDFAPDSEVRRKRSENFLRQDIDFEQGRTVLEEAYEAL
jgi:ATP-binding cassette subfamily F protein 3